MVINDISISSSQARNLFIKLQQAHIEPYVEQEYILDTFVAVKYSVGFKSPRGYCAEHIVLRRKPYLPEEMRWELGGEFGAQALSMLYSAGIRIA